MAFNPYYGYIPNQYGKLDKRSRLDCKSRRELGSTATCLQT